MEIELGKLLRALRRYWWLPVVGAALMAVAGGMIGQVNSNTYTATTRMLIIPSDVSGQSVIGNSPSILIDLATSRPVLRQVIESNGLDLTEEELRSQILVVQQKGTSILLVSVSSDDAEQAASISNSVAETLVARANDLTTVELQNKTSDLEFRSNDLRDRITLVDTRIEIINESGTTGESQVDAEMTLLREERLALSQEKADVDSSIRGLRAQLARTYTVVNIVEQAEIPERKDGLPPVIVAIIGGFVGGFAGAVLLLVAAVRDTTIVTGTQVQRITGFPVLREINPTRFEHDLRMIILFINELKQAVPEGQGRVSVVAPTYLPQFDQQSAEYQDSSTELAIANQFPLANGAILDEDALLEGLRSSAVVIAAKLGITREEDLRSVINLLKVAGVPVIGSIVFREE